MVVAAWATIEDVDTYTTVQVTEDELLRAQDIIELFSGTTILSSNAGNISARNLRMLNRAVCYQAAWMTERPDLYTHIDLETTSQDGASVTPRHVNAALLAPLAKRWLDRITWKTAPLRVRRGYGSTLSDDYTNRDSAVADDSRVWIPL